MEINNLREPVQKRSIEKKEKIISKGFDLICEKGYHNTNTAEIAKVAGVSTGIVYQYFKDKHDILIEGIKKYAKDIFYPMLSVTNNIVIDKNNLKSILKQMIDKFIENHKLSQSAHEELTAMIHSDNEIATLFQEYEIYITNEITELLLKNNFSTDNLQEKVHITINLVDNLCHEIVYHKHSEINYNIMTELVINTIADLLNS
ncbi:MAG: TetR/AcrR family transcriptional regulator [Clostridia bacterium]|nr:TetR/AcrR family transcriptional regulator [Clostridia bacterium]